MQIRNIVEFRKFLDQNLQFRQDNYIYRGHGDKDWELKPRIARRGEKQRIYNLDENIFLIHEREFLEEFVNKYKRHSDLKYTPPNLLETLMTARHFGFPTRLLDWTSNPLIALFFAVYEEWNKDGIVWCFDTSIQTIKEAQCFS